MGSGKKEKNVGENAFYFIFIMMACIRILSKEKLDKDLLDPLESVMKKVYEIAPSYLGVNVKSLRFHTFFAHSVTCVKEVP